MFSTKQALAALVICMAFGLGATDHRPIGVFDSGTGGLTVLEQLLKLDRVNNATGACGADGVPDFQGEDFVYFGDQANMPYGDYAAAGKSEFLKGLVVNDAKFLLSKDAKIIVIACNTATAYGYDAVAELLAQRGDGTRVIGVVNAGARAAIDQLNLVKDPQPCAIGVLATPGTIASGVYARTIKAELEKLGVTCEVQVFSRGCAGLADAVETGSSDAPKIACDNLRALMAEHQAKAPHLPLKAIILGCTHFPFVLNELRAVTPKGVVFVDPAVYTAVECRQALVEQGRVSADKTATDVATYISVAAPGLDASKLDGKGGLARAWKYGRDDPFADRSTVPVPLAEATKGEPMRFIPFGHMIPRVREQLLKAK